MRETEVKFAVHGSFTLPTFENAVVQEVEALPELDLKATYYDTPDLRLARSGITLRYRTGEGDGPAWHLKFPVEGDGGRTREELEFQGSARAIPRKVEDLLVPHVRRARVAPVEAMQTRRRRWLLKDETGMPLAEVVDDEVSVLQKGRVITRFRELELEKREARDKDFEKLVKQLRAAGAEESEPIPKVVRVLGPRATAPSDLPDTPELPRDATGADLVKTSLADGLQRLVHNDPAARRGEVEGVHQMRVATRRLRSDLRTFSPLLDEAWSREVIDELKWLGNQLGGVRELDVLIARLSSAAEDSGPKLIPLFNRLAEEHEAARASLDDALRSERYKSLLDRLIDAARLPLFTEQVSGSAEKLGPALVAPTWQKLRKAARTTHRTSPDEALHEVRIRTKRARYAAEAVAPALTGEAGAAARRFAKAAADLQDALGGLQDAVVARETILRCLAESGPDPKLHFSAGRLYERESRVASQSRASFRAAWENLDRRKNLSWLKTGP